MLQRGISIEAIKLLTDMLVNMAGHCVLRCRWKEGNETMTRFRVRHDPFFEANRDATVAFISEPDFVLEFRRVDGAHVVDLVTLPDRVIRHTWTRHDLEDAFNSHGL